MWKNAPDLSSVIEIKELHKQFQSIDKKQEKADETPKKGTTLLYYNRGQAMLSLCGRALQ